MQHEERIADLEARIAKLEKGDQPEWKPPTEEELPESDYPYLATLPPELKGKIEVRYKFYLETQREAMIMISGRLKNLSNQEITAIYGKFIVKDREGNTIDEPGGFGSTYFQPIKSGELRGIGGSGAGGDWLNKWLKTHNPDSLFVEMIVTKVEFA